MSTPVFGKNNQQNEAKEVKGGTLLYGFHPTAVANVLLTWWHRSSSSSKQLKNSENNRRLLWFEITEASYFDYNKERGRTGYSCYKDCHPSAAAAAAAGVMAKIFNTELYHQ